MTGVLFEVDTGGGWMVASHQRSDDTMRSFVAHDEDGAPLSLVYGWITGVPGLWQAANLGPGREDQGEVLISPAAAGFELIADLREGPHERTVWTPRRTEIRVRWSIT